MSARARERGPRPPSASPATPRTKAPKPADAVRELIEAIPGVTTPPAGAVEPEPLPLVKGPIEGPVRILFVDVDGTLTDGRIVEHHDGDSRNFWVRDGLALQWARDLGVLPVAISGRPSKAVEHRMKDLGLEHYVGIKDKVEVAEKVLAREKATWAQCVMVGDDLPDVPLLKRAGWPVAVADAQPEVKARAKTITSARGGRGAVREVVEMVLRHNGTWEKVLGWYEAT